MAVDFETRALLNKQLLAAARQGGNLEDVLYGAEYQDPEDDDVFPFDINCTDPISGNTPLHLAVLNGSIENVDLLTEADGCDVDPQNSAGDTPLHLAVRIQHPDIRYAIIHALVEMAGATDSTRLKNKAGQTPHDLSRIYCPDDANVASLTIPPARKVNDILGKDDIASGGEDEPGSASD